MFKTRLISGIVLVLAALLVIISGGPVLYRSFDVRYPSSERES